MSRFLCKIYWDIYQFLKIMYSPIINVKNVHAIINLPMQSPDQVIVWGNVCAMVIFPYIFQHLIFTSIFKYLMAREELISGLVYYLINSLEKVLIFLSCLLHHIDPRFLLILAWYNYTSLQMLQYHSIEIYHSWERYQPHHIFDYPQHQ